MPIFEYECGSCGNRFEELMSRSDPDPGCPSCDSSEVTRLISNTSFRLKGTGWYTTDYASTSRKGGGGKDTHSDSNEKTDAKAPSEGGSSATPSDSAPKSSASNGKAKAAAA